MTLTMTLTQMAAQQLGAALEDQLEREVVAVIERDLRREELRTDNARRRRENFAGAERRIAAGEKLTVAEVHAVVARHERLLDELRAIDRGLLGG